MATFDELLKHTRELLTTIQDVELQLELHRFYDVLVRARSDGISDVTTNAEAALAAASSSNVNINIVREIRNRIDLAILNKRSGFVSNIRRRLGDSPVYAMLWGTALAFILSIALFGLLATGWIFLIKSGVNLVAPVRLNELITVSFAAIVGACLSLLSRSNFFADLYVYDPFLIFVNCLIKPIIACGLAVTVYCLFASEIIKVVGLSDLFTFQGDRRPVADALWVLGFIVGFGERLATDLISRTESIFSGTP